jgi:hypothetical protein
LDGSPDDFRKKTNILLDHCDEVERDPQVITKTWAAFVFIDEIMDNAIAKMKKRFSRVETTSSGRGLVGAPESIRQDVYRYIDSG